MSVLLIPSLRQLFVSIVRLMVGLLYCIPGTAIQWGAIGDVGVAFDLLGGNQDVAIGGTLPQRIVSCLATLDSLLCRHEAVVSSFVLAESSLGKSDSAASGVSLREAVAHILG